MVNRSQKRVSHHRFSDLPSLLDRRDILARNNSRVIPARLIGHREATGGKWEGLFLRDLGGGLWEILATTRGRPLPGELIIVGQGLATFIYLRNIMLIFRERGRQQDGMG